MPAFALKRVYEPPETEDGARVLVDRLWPRGLTKEKAAVDLWAKEVAPSHELRRWFGHRPERWEEFEARYREELESPEAQEQIATLRHMARKERVTLLYAAHDEALNNAVVLREVLRHKVRS
ncbi:DUF488 domain-containing protein [Methylocystis sp. MJC1]|uniref:DUF488 domain-containing protein n=1 Tax=Methylocystis sp. MJC1 TaxID=2654282 RepID=UPI0013EDE3F0|nr:DUF488 domain-containing protein [Methylocystis sp. MJC1]KAF2991897.1 hypothetical protein MJC1_00919 [Methylocystis sp. MJC1]MBU6529000.1 DUF488 domain-containing protein [Methylocystis sp. MJC1]UZX11879.1 DUF488 domain-containing protein [Methylocystis sp. MJC1]